MAADLHLLTDFQCKFHGSVHEVLCVILSVISWHRGYFSVIRDVIGESL